MDLRLSFPPLSEVQDLPSWLERQSAGAARGAPRPGAVAGQALSDRFITLHRMGFLTLATMEMPNDG